MDEYRTSANPRSAIGPCGRHRDGGGGRDRHDSGAVDGRSHGDRHGQSLRERSRHSLSPASRSFTTANWNTYQTFTVTGVQDSDTVDDSATVTLRASGGGVSDSASVTVTITDDVAPTPTPTPSPAISGTGVRNDPYVIPPSLLNTDIDCTRLPNWRNLTNAGAYFRFTVPTTGTWRATFAFAPSPKRSGLRRRLRYQHVNQRGVAHYGHRVFDCRCHRQFRCGPACVHARDPDERDAAAGGVDPHAHPDPGDQRHRREERPVCDPAQPAEYRY